MLSPETKSRWTRWFSGADLLILFALGALIYGLIDVGEEWRGPLRPAVNIELRPSALPFYALYSLFRGFVAYLLSLAFTLVYGYIAAYNRRAEKIMVPLLDILQSIPVLGFLPGLVLALVAAFPNSNIGLELACILMIFTGQVWNMTFSFYHSLRSIPAELRESSKVFRMSWWQRFTQLELPFAAGGLIWNSMMSMAGGWFFLTITEAFVLGDKDFRVPGIGSYMSVAIQQGDFQAMSYGVIAMALMILAVDQLFWRPIVAWSQKFKFEESEASAQPTSLILKFLQQSQWIPWLEQRLWKPLLKPGKVRKPVEPHEEPAQNSRSRKMFVQSLGWLFMLALAIGVLWQGLGLFGLLSQISWDEWLELSKKTEFTFLRVVGAIALGTLWTVPVGVAIGMNPRLSRFLQPAIQILASFPAPMLYPLVLGALAGFGMQLGIGSMFLILLGTQWYILFNVIAGATAIPQELCEASRVYRLSFIEKWRRLILPGIFPHLVTGWVTAMGGAWNASIVAEYVNYNGSVMSTEGLGSAISLATDRGNFPLLAASVLAMCVAVVGINRFVWQKLYHVAEERFSLTK